jgi:hypothetical protein
MYFNEIIAPAFMGPLAIFRCFLLSRSYPDRDSSSLNPPAGGAPPAVGGRTDYGVGMGVYPAGPLLSLFSWRVLHTGL